MKIYYLKILLHFCLIIVVYTHSYITKSIELHVTKGKFFIHMLHSAYFFTNTGELFFN